MNKNSYVTAALFVVFVLLTVFYMGMEDPKDLTTGAGSTQTLPNVQMEVSETDAQTGSELASETTTEENVTTVATESNSIQVLRVELEKQQSQKVSELKEVIASKDYDATAKSEAKDDLDKLNRDREHQSALETMIKSKGYNDVLVRVNEETVQVIVQVADESAFPGVEEVNELYMMAKTEFTNNPDVTIQCQPINYIKANKKHTDPKVGIFLS